MGIKPLRIGILGEHNDIASAGLAAKCGFEMVPLAGNESALALDALIIRKDSGDLEKILSTLPRGCSLLIDLPCQNKASIEELTRCCTNNKLEASLFMINLQNDSHFASILKILQAPGLTNGSMISLTATGVETRGPIYRSRLANTAEMPLRIDSILATDTGADPFSFHVSALAFAELSLSLARELNAKTVPILKWYATSLAKNKWLMVAQMSSSLDRSAVLTLSNQVEKSFEPLPAQKALISNTSDFIAFTAAQNLIEFCVVLDSNKKVEAGFFSSHSKFNEKTAFRHVVGGNEIDPLNTLEILNSRSCVTLPKASPSSFESGVPGQERQSPKNSLFSKMSEQLIKNKEQKSAAPGEIESHAEFVAYLMSVLPQTNRAATKLSRIDKVKQDIQTIIDRQTKQMLTELLDRYLRLVDSCEQANHKNASREKKATGGGK
ncbi:MAG: hypothetical protein AB1540_04545 [Bdellovibrionota bacterium]